MTDSAKIRRALAKLSGKKYRAKLYRTVLHQDQEAILEIWPSQIHGWRFNPQGEFGALYLGDSPENCVRETFKHIPNVKVFLGRPRALGTLEVHLHKCLDLTDEDIMAELGVAQEVFLEEGSKEALWVAREARKAGFEAILYPSAIDSNSVNLALFRDCLHPQSSCVLIKIDLLSDKELARIVQK